MNCSKNKVCWQPRICLLQEEIVGRLSAMSARRKIIINNFFKKDPKKQTSRGATLWQKEQKDRKKRKNFRKIFLGIFLFGLLTTFYFLNYFRAVVVNPYHPLPTNIDYNSNPNQNYRVNILLISTEGGKTLKDLVVATYDKEEGTLKWLKIPTGVYLNLPSDYGWGDLKSAYLLGQTEEKQKGVDVLVRGVELLLAAKVDGYIAVNDSSVSFDEEDLDKIRKYAFGPTFFLKSLAVNDYLSTKVHTSLTPWSLVSLSLKAKEVRFDKAKFKDLSDFMTEDTREGQKYPVLDIASLDNYLKEVLSEPKILADLAKIEVRNSTKKPGLASLASRVITNLGGNVVYTGNSDDNLEQTKIYVYGNRHKTADRLGEVLGAKVETKKPDNEIRGDIVVQVGLDFFERIKLQ